MIADDLFAGAGGWDIGAQPLGIHARGIEIMKEARATRDAASLKNLHDDVWTFQPDGHATGLIASPPCQTFSAAGKGTGRKALDDVLRGIRDGYTRSLDELQFLGQEVGDDRTALVLTPLHFALNHEYEWLAWEQVPTVLPVWEACAEVLKAQGWNAWTGLLHAEQYGVPQTRKRAFLLASRHHEVGPPTPTHSRYYSRTPTKLDAGVLPWVSMADVLGLNLGDFAGAGRTSVKTSGQIPRRPSQPAHTITGGASAAWVFRGSNQAHAALRPDSHPAPTLLFGHCSNDVRWYPAGTTRRGIPEAASGRHPDSRQVTVNEAGILQTFPDGYPWQGTKSKQYLQVGNAVPPGLATPALAVASGVTAREVAA